MQDSPPPFTDVTTISYAGIFTSSIPNSNRSSNTHTKRSHMQSTIDWLMSTSRHEPESDPANAISASTTTFLMDLGGRFLRSSLHTGPKEFVDLPMMAMEFVLERDGLEELIQHCMKREVFQQLQVKQCCCIAGCRCQLSI